MVFGKIEYLNLLPFHIFMKKYVKGSSASMGMNYYKDVPAKINAKFISRKVDAAFISSISAKKYLHVGLGIIAKKEVLSVLVIPNDENKTDKESASSNVLARILGIKGEVLIGDKALKYYLNNSLHIDLANEWNKRYNLPFVFALLCFHKDKKKYKNIEKEFLKQKIRIPQYILNQASLRTGIAQKDILNYLKYISYEVDEKALRGVKAFYKKASLLV